MYEKILYISTKDLCICAKNLTMYAKIFHVSIRDMRICAKNPALEDFVIPNHY